MDQGATADSVGAILQELGIRTAGSNGHEIACYCPFHQNNNSPAFSINSQTGAWKCFNGGCDGSAGGSLKRLWDLIKPGEEFPLAKSDFFAKLKQQRQTLAINELLAPEVEESKFDWSEVTDKLSHLENDLEYMLRRGFTKSTLDLFEIAYSAKKNAIVIPVRNDSFRLVGLIGRLLDPDAKPRYTYTRGFGKKEILFNLQNAKVFRSVILVEGSLDCMKVVQAGFPNTCAVLGSNLSDEQTALIGKYFSDVVIFSDNDEAGIGLAKNIAYKCGGMNISYVDYGDLPYTDPGEMPEEEIRRVIENRLSDIEVMVELMG